MRYVLLFLLVLATGCSTIENRQYPTPKLLKQIDIGEIVNHKAYTLSYNEKYKQPNWVEYSLRCSDLDKNIKRTNDYRADPFVKAGTLSPSDYKGSGYDQGHLAPARDMSRSYEIMSESFYLSNMAPQLPYFNRYGLWIKSERAVREWACQNEVLHIVAGPVLDNSVKFKGRLSIPSRFFKVILASNEKMIAFIFPNSEINDDIMKYAKTVHEVENITGIDFFSTLPDELEERLESSIDLKKWMISKDHRKFKDRKVKTEKVSETDLFYAGKCEKGSLMEASLHGCCSNHGGVYGPKRGVACCTIDKKVICADGGVSPGCSCN